MGLSTSQLARGLEVSRTTIHNWEGGKPIPIERCAHIADYLGMDPAELLALHPHSISLHLNGRPDSPVDTGRLVRVGLVVVVLVTIATMLFTWLTARADCVTPGAGGGSSLGPFRDAFDTYGGAVALGCATNEVHKWGPAVAQDFEGGSMERSTLMSLDGRDVYLVAGDMWWDYVAIAAGATPDFAGVPNSPVLRCGSAVVLLLEGGFSGPGALVSNTDGHFTWLPGDIWLPYAQAGGPIGDLGQPESDRVDLDGDEIIVQFEGGTIVHERGVGPTVSPVVEAVSFATVQCQPLSAGF